MPWNAWCSIVGSSGSSLKQGLGSGGPIGAFRSFCLVFLPTVCASWLSPLHTVASVVILQAVRALSLFLAVPGEVSHVQASVASLPLWFVWLNTAYVLSAKEDSIAHGPFDGVRTVEPYAEGCMFRKRCVLALEPCHFNDSEAFRCDLVFLHELRHRLALVL